MIRAVRINASVAQLVEQLICNQQVVGSMPIRSSRIVKYAVMLYWLLIVLIT